MENNQQPQPNMQQQMDQMLQQQGQAQPVQPMQPMNGPAKKKKKCNVPAIVLGVVAVLGVGAGVYFGMQYFGEKDRADRLAKQNTTVATTTETAETPGEGTAEVASSQVSYGFDASKIKNSTNGEIYQLLVDSGQDGVGGSLSKDGKTLTLSFSSGRLQEVGFTNYRDFANLNDSKKITFDQPVVNMMLGGMGQDVTGDAIFYIMEDGSLKYTSINKLVTEKSFEVHGTVDGVKNAVMLYSVTYSPGVTGGGVMTMVQDKDGNIYDIYKLLGDGEKFNHGKV